MLNAAPSITTLLYVFAVAGSAVFAASGVLAAGRRNLDWIGALVLAMVTATGGGTLRDMLMDRPIFWISDTNYLYAALGAAGATIAWLRWSHLPERALQYADAFGIALFGISGAQIAETGGLPPVLVVLMGTITATAGGLIRDVLSAEVPLVFRKSELYVTAVVAGTATYAVLRYCGWSIDTASLTAAAALLSLRLASIRWNITLPTVNVRDQG